MAGYRPPVMAAFTLMPPLLGSVPLWQARMDVALKPVLPFGSWSRSVPPPLDREFVVE